MSALAALIDGLFDLAVADTGAGGLYNASPLITRAYTLQAYQEATLPYLVILPVVGSDESSFAKDTRIVQIQFSVFSAKDSGLTAQQAITARMKTVYRRVIPTVTGWTVSPGTYTDAQTFIDEDTIHTVIEAEYAMTAA